MREKDQVQIEQPAQRERAFVNSQDFETYHYIATRLTDEGLGAYLVMEDPEVTHVEGQDRIPIVVISPHRRSDIFWETVHGLTRELRHVTAERISEVRKNFMAGKIARIKEEAVVYGRNPYANPKLRNLGQH